MTALLETDRLTLGHGRNVVLRDVTLHIAAGEIVTIVGPNGSGKSTLLKALTGALKPQSGRITRARGLRIGYVPQKLTLDATMPLTVDRFLALSGATKPDRTKMLSTVGLAEEVLGAQLAALSGGQFQRALLAHALLHEPTLLVLDEAAQGLDQPGVAAFYKLIEELRTRTGCAVLMVSHDLHVVMSASDRVICVNGHICCEGTPTVVSEAPEYRALFGLGTEGTLALYQHKHDHTHGEHCSHD